MAGRSWTCARCGMTTSFQKGSPKRAKPEGWAKEGKEWHCLRCRRELVMEKAVEESGDESKAVQRRALTEFELIRDPEATDREIARRVKCPSGLVGPIRESLIEAGRLEAPDG
jgi:predicted nucleic-acid-binding Zn-ribbon protein